MKPDFSLCLKCNRFQIYKQEYECGQYICRNQCGPDWILADITGGTIKNISNVPKSCSYNLEQLFKNEERKLLKWNKKN